MLHVRVIGDRSNKGIREKVIVNRVMNHKKKKKDAIYNIYILRTIESKIY